ncbi:XkdX family protein [Brevibacillus panacihumi]
MTDFQKWQYYFDRGWATSAQVRQVVSFGKLTPEQFEQITGEKYDE